MSLKGYEKLLSSLGEQPDFCKSQEASAKAVYRLLGPLVKQGHVRTIYDLGCGDGWILTRLHERFQDAWRRSDALPDWVKSKAEGGEEGSLALVGLDPVGVLQLCGKGRDDGSGGQKAKPIVTLSFLEASAADWSSSPPDGRRAAILVLGHTIFHLAPTWKDLLRLVRRLDAAVWVVDIHERWDVALEALRNTQVFEEGHSFLRGSHLILRTRAQDASKCGLRTVSRVLTNGDETLLETSQLAMPSRVLEKAFEKRGYLRTHRLEHFSGWGPMEARLFVACQRGAAKAANDAYYDAIKSALHYVFVAKASDSRYEFLRATMRLFRVKCAAVILPFDEIHTFGRYASVMVMDTEMDTEAASRISKESMILEEPTHDQDTFPTAYGLFSCILDSRSTMQSFPLHRIANYEMAEVDWEFSELEDRFLKASTQPRGAITDDRPYFMLPVFFGGVPLFVLVLQFDNTFPEKDTAPSLYPACLLSLHGQLKRALEEEEKAGTDPEAGVTFLQVRILRPFVRGLARQLEPGSLSATMEELMRAVTGKPWKSWVDALPATRVSTVKIVDTEADKLRRRLAREVEHIERDVFWSISRILESHEFFQGEAHDWPEEVHRRVARHLGGSRAEICKRLQLGKVRPARESESQAEFRVVDWAAEALAAMKDCEEPHTPNQVCRSGCLWRLRELKALFCREGENKGARMRFSVPRLCLLARLALDRIPRVVGSPTHPTDVYAGWMGDAIEERRKFPPTTDDPSELLWSTLVALKELLGSCDSVSVEATTGGNRQVVGVAVQWRQPGKDSPTLGGSWTRAKEYLGKCRCKIEGPIPANANVIFRITLEDATGSPRADIGAEVTECPS